MHPEFPDEDIMALFKEKLDKDRDKWIVWFDGASNVLGHGVGAVLVSPDNQCIPFTARLGFDYTNNMAEYEVCVPWPSRRQLTQMSNYSRCTATKRW